MNNSPEAFVAIIFGLFARRGNCHYGETVTQLDHALQTAHNARTAGEPEALVAAALLHDIGHLVHDEGEDAADRAIDLRHQQIGAEWLAQGFGPELTEPVRLHVEAKRYLAACEPGYVEGLSRASIDSLRLQGGPMTEAEANAFLGTEYCDAAIRLRQYDDLGKIDGAQIPRLATYREQLLALAVRD